MTSKYGSLTLPELRSEVRKRRARISGRKKDLIERLESYDKNSNFGLASLDDIGPEVQMQVPVDSLYCDINTDKHIPSIDKNKIDLYLETFDKTLEDKSVNLYKERYLLYVRSCAQNELFFIRSACRAELKKHIVYTIDISLTKDGHVYECQCECGSGMGLHAHCKHIVTVLYGLCQLNATGSLLVEETCTQRLQTFHHSKKFTGSPLKAVDINMPGACESTSQTFDPRPPVYRNNIGYQSYFQNICLNFRGISKMPIFHIFPPANILAVAHDHDYLKETPEDSFLRDIGILGLGANERKEIQEQTLGQASSDIWHKERQKRIHSSNFGRICKATERTNLKQLALSLMMRKNLKTEAILHGRKYEQDAIRRYEVDNNVHVSKCGIFVSKDYSFLGASPDGIVDDNLLCEVKCPFSAKNKQISTTTVPYLRLNGSNGSLSLDTAHDYYFQIQGQLLCSDRSACDLIVYTLVDVKYVHIPRDDEFIKDMIEKLQSFYKNYFEAAILEKLFYKSFIGF